MTRQRIVRDLDERDRLQAAAERDPGYLAGSFRTYDAGSDSQGGRLYLCYWRWIAPLQVAS